MSEVEVACRRCYGTGKLYSPIPKENGEPTYICPECKGKKVITPPPLHPEVTINE